ncbi:hypothetical protein KC318_g11192, partial [Hortaea werneckii]
NKRAKFAKEAAFLQHVQWFDEFVKGQRDIAARTVIPLLSFCDIQRQELDPTGNITSPYQMSR